MTDDLQNEMQGILSGMNPDQGKKPAITKEQAGGLLADCRDIARKLAPMQNDGGELTPAMMRRVVSTCVSVANLLEPYSGSIAVPTPQPQPPV